MVIVDLLRWWYSAGWSWVLTNSLFERNKKILAVLSFKDVVRTLFAPYRQTFAGGTRGGVGDRIRGMVDQLVSRTIGFVVRATLILTALVTVLVNTVISVLAVVVWPFIPVLPIIAVALMIAGFNNAV